MTAPKDMIGFVRITKAPQQYWVGIEGPLRHKLPSDGPWVCEGMLVFGLVPNPDPDGPKDPVLVAVHPDGIPGWDFELIRRFPGGRDSP